MSDINSAIRRSVSIYFVGRYSNIAIQLGVTALLARMLDPADFGVIAVVSVLVTLFSFLSEMGLGPAVIQFRDLGSDRLCALFWLSVGMGIVVAVLFACSGPAIAHFYHEPRYVDIAALLSFSIASSCWGIVPLAMLRKAQRFRAIVLIEVTAAVVSGLAALVSARSGAGVLALVVKSNVYGVLMFALALTASRPDLRRRPCWSGMGGLMKYSGYQFLFNLVNYASRNLDKLLIGKWMGPAALGVYDMSYRLMLMPVSNLTQVISPALQPVYAACGDRDVIFGSYRNVLRLLAIVGGYAGLCCLMCSREIILLIYGPKWGAAAGIFTILSYSIAIQVVLSSTGAIFQVIGRTDLLALSGTLSAVSTVGAMLLGARSGDLSVFSWWVIGSFAMNAVQAFVLLAHAGLGRTVVDLLKPMLPCFCLTAALTLAGVLLPARWDAPGWPVGISLIVKLATVTAAYGVGLAVTGDVAFLKRAVGRRNRAASMGAVMVEATTTSRHARSEQRKGKAACVFSVIVPVFNVEPFLLEALDSLAAQTRTDFEVLIVDDGSTDRSPEIAQEYCRRDSRFSYHRQDNAGASSARNRGIALALGTYLYFMDGDDRIDTDTLERCLEALLANDVDIVFFNAQVFPTDAPNYPLYRDYYTRPSLTSPVSGTRFLQASLEQQRYFVQPCCYVARRTAIGTLRFVEGVMYEDNHFLVALLTHGPLRVSVLERRFFHRRLRSGSVMTSPRGERHYRSLLVVVMRIGELPFPILSSGERATLLGPVFDSLLGDLHSLSARMRITPRRRLDNLRALMHAARHAPRHILTLKRIALAVAPELYRLRSGG